MDNKDQYEGEAKNIGGKVQEGAGKLTGDEEMEARGKANQAKGKVEKAFGNAKDAVKDAADSIRRKD